MPRNDLMIGRITEESTWGTEVTATILKHGHIAAHPLFNICNFPNDGDDRVLFTVGEVSLLTLSGNEIATLSAKSKNITEKKVLKIPIQDLGKVNIQVKTFMDAEESVPLGFVYLLTMPDGKRHLGFGSLFFTAGDPLKSKFEWSGYYDHPRKGDCSQALLYYLITPESRDEMGEDGYFNVRLSDAEGFRKIFGSGLRDHEYSKYAHVHNAFGSELAIRSIFVEVDYTDAPLVP